MKEQPEYEAPQVRDLEELGIRGQFPLGTNTCTFGTGNNNTCLSGSNAGNTACSDGNLGL
jgi:hypothetical protein